MTSTVNTPIVGADQTGSATPADPSRAVRVLPGTAPVAVPAGGEIDANRSSLRLAARLPRLRGLASRLGASRVTAPIAVAAGALVVGLWHSGTPSFWGDEAASVMSAERSIPSLMSELSVIDAVHGLYYLLLHFWIGLVGDSEFAVRFPSVVASAAAVAGVVVLGRRLFGTAVGVTAGAMLAIVPEFSRLAIEGRSYAFGTAAAVWLTVLLVAIAARRDSRMRAAHSGLGRTRALWALYIVGWVLAIHLFVFLAMVAVGHAALLLALRVPRPTWRRWFTAGAIVLATITPIAIVTFTQRHQVGFLAARGYATPDNVLVSQWFITIPMAVIGWGLVAVAVIGAARARREQRSRLAAIAVWMAGPTLIVLGVSAVAQPIYNQRYLAMSMPALALVMAFGAVAGVRMLSELAARRAPRRAVAAVAAAAIGAALLSGAAPAYLAQRSAYGKGGADFRQTAEALATHAAAGDAVIFDQTVKPSQRPRVILHLYPQLTQKLDDVALRTPFDQKAGIWDSVWPVDRLGDRLAGHRVVWAVEVTGSGSPDLTQLHRLGYVETQTIPVHRTVLIRLEKDPS
ncbi:glycosyltransferase family 39 protein [Schumannella soli]|uniref:Glycosyltransferase RgtA/B/C/D-like domain-containing protein n=1 Tax=Schumannella soli TaxID=2590779 RepID=A0A506Y9Z2_9MICO|nr:glycosyltransferase family 39 protein [Schumannella soli]TPW77958.1 hypothetical protein FJ657_04785 [Schumannella soli]